MSSEIVEKTYINYFVERTETTSIDTTEIKETYCYPTFDTEYNFMIEYDEEKWEAIEEMPEDAFKLKTVVTKEEIEDGEKTVTDTYYFQYYTKEEEIDVRDPSECQQCVYLVKTNKCFRRYECKAPDHIIHSYISGHNWNGDCRDYNMHGECLSFTLPPEEEIPGDEDIPSDEDIPGDETDDDANTDDTESDNTDPAEPTDPDSSDDTEDTEDDGNTEEEGEING